MRQEVPSRCPPLETPRMLLEPITEHHAAELCELFADPELHRYVPFEPLPLDRMRERCARWERRRSPDGDEIWLNWIARLLPAPGAIAHFQAGVRPDGVASVGYLVSRRFQRRGLATEGLEAVFEHLRLSLDVREVKAWIDTRNKASLELARRLGMRQTEHLANADFFKGEPSDEFVFSKALGTVPGATQSRA